MKIISVWSPKGGVGKSTIAINMASGLAAQNKRVLVIDLDDQMSAYNLHKKGGVDWDCVNKMPNDKPNYDVVIFDHPPGQRKVPDAATVIVPFAPSMIDYDSFKTSLGLLAGKTFFTVVNKVDNRVNDDREFAKLAKEQGAYIIGLRHVYKSTYKNGHTVFDAPGNSQALRKAKTEIQQLIEKVA